MDKIVIIAIVVAVIAVVGVGLMLNQPAPAKPTTPIVTEPVDETPDNTPVVHPKPAINYTNATYGVQLTEVEGNCKLYKHVAKEEYKCFGTAGNYSIMATNEYRVTESETYFCKPTVYGCRLYEKVYIQPL